METDKLLLLNSIKDVDSMMKILEALEKLHSIIPNFLKPTREF